MAMPANSVIDFQTRQNLEFQFQQFQENSIERNVPGEYDFFNHQNILAKTACQTNFNTPLKDVFQWQRPRLYSNTPRWGSDFNFSDF